jgi:hypothetical protein
MTMVMVVNDELTYSEVFPCRLVCEAINCYIVLISRYRILDSNLCLDRLEASQFINAVGN